jgi:hypothetical protein
MQNLKEQMEQAGWGNVRVLDPSEHLRGPDGVEAFGEDEGGDVSIHIDAGRGGTVRGFEVYRKEIDNEVTSSGRIPYRSVPTPEGAMGAWEERMADQARGLA